MLARKHEQNGRDPLLDCEDVRTALRKAAAEGCRDLVCVISATNILEAGCDLDFDWAVTEPCSERSFVQLAGRVRRHRPWLWGPANVAILQEAVSQGGRWLEKPGVETPIPLDGQRGEVRASLNGMGHAEDIFPLAAWSTVVDATTCLTDRESAAGTAEAAIIAAACEGDHDSMSSLIKTGALETVPAPLTVHEKQALRFLSVAGHCSDASVLWTDLQARERVFRRNDTIKYDLSREVDGWSRINTGDRKATWARCDNRVTMEPDLGGNSKALGRMLLSPETYDIELSAAAIEQRLADRTETPPYIGRELRALSYDTFFSGTENEIFFEPVLGADMADSSSA